jgi:MerR family mercuric resistance operon transcriptional regulator
LQKLKLALNEMVSQCKGADSSVAECSIIDALYVKK